MARHWLFALLIVALAVPAGVLAQEEEERGQLLQVVTWEIQPDHLEDWAQAIKDVVAAAEAAEVGADYGWFFWSRTNHYTFVYPIDSFAYFDDPTKWISQFQGTAGEEMLNAAFAKFASVNSRVLADEIIESQADWKHEVATEIDGKYAHVDMFWVRSGKEEEFNAVAAEIIALMGEIEFAYPVSGYEVQFGDTGRVDFVTLIDDMSAYHGENSLMAAIEAHGAGEKWGELVERFNATYYRWEHEDYVFEPEMTYWPEPASE